MPAVLGPVYEPTGVYFSDDDGRFGVNVVCYFELRVHGVTVQANSRSGDVGDFIDVPWPVSVEEWAFDAVVCPDLLNITYVGFISIVPSSIFILELNHEYGSVVVDHLR